MIFAELCMFSVLFSFSTGNDQLKPGLIQEFSNVFHNLSNLALMPHLMETPNCRLDCEIYRQAFLQNQIWAAEMFDANGRQSLGILKGNLHQLGNINQCLTISSSPEISDIEGKFCIIKIFLKPLESNTFMGQIWKTAFNKSFLTSEPYKRNVFVSSNTILSTLCVPSSCTARELMIASRKVLSVFNETAFGLEAHVDNVNEENCIIQREYNPKEVPMLYFVKAFIVTMLILVSSATIVDFNFPQNVQNDRHASMILSKSFSLRQNLSTFMKVENDKDSIGCLNGLRCIVYLLLFLMHYNLKFLIFVVDRSDFSQILRCPFIESALKNFFFALDMLIFLSGITHSYKLTPFVQRNNGKLILNSMLHKYLRFLLVLPIFAFIQSTLINKNQFHLLYVPRKSTPNYWSIVFCFENFYGIENMFFGPLHTFYTDIQLYFVSCVLLWLTRHYNDKVKLLFSIAFGSLFCRSLYVYFYSDLQIFFSFGMYWDQIMDLVYFMYSTPFCKLPFYVSGVALGYYLRKKSNHKANVSSFQLCKKVNRILPLLCLCVAIYLYYPTGSHREYNSLDGAVLFFGNSMCTLIFLIWMVWYCETFKKLSIIYRFLAADTFVILNRLIPYFSALHLCVLYVAVVGTRFLFEFKLSEMLGLDYLLLTILVCAFVTLFIDLPLRNTWTYLVAKKDATAMKNKCE